MLSSIDVVTNWSAAGSGWRAEKKHGNIESMNKTPEQRARDAIDPQLLSCGWIVQDKARLNLHAAPGVAVREYRTDVGPADYVLFVDGKPVGVIEAKREEAAESLSVHEDQAEG